MTSFCELQEWLPRLEGRGVVLRWLGPQDAPFLYAIFSDADVVRYMSIPRLQSPQDAADLLETIHSRCLEGSLYQWGVQWGGEIVGTVMLFDIDCDNGKAEMDFALGKKYWGMRLMARSISVLVDHAFGSIGLRRVEVDTDPRNTSAIRVLKALGFRREGLLRERYLREGEVRDSLLFSLLRREWQAGVKSSQ